MSNFSIHILVRHLIELKQCQKIAKQPQKCPENKKCAERAKKNRYKVQACAVFSFFLLVYHNCLAISHTLNLTMTLAFCERFMEKLNVKLFSFSHSFSFARSGKLRRSKNKKTHFEKWIHLFLVCRHKNSMSDYVIERMSTFSRLV